MWALYDFPLGYFYQSGYTPPMIPMATAGTRGKCAPDEDIWR